MSRTKSSEPQEGSVYDRLSQWLEDIKTHELTNIIQLIEQAKAYVIAAESIPEEKVNQFIDNFTYDLHQFYLINQTALNRSLYIGLLKETFWQAVADITDKSQVEWAELTDDFQHRGHYKTGDYIGFGEIVCSSCSNSQEIFHLTQLSGCAACSGNDFTRQPFSP